MLECLFDQETVFNNFLNTKIYEAENRGKEQGREEASILSMQKTISRLNRLGISREEIIGIITEDYGLSKAESADRVTAYLG